MLKIFLIIALPLIILFPGDESFSKVLMSREEALKTVYPDADSVERNSVFLSASLKEKIAKRSKTEVDSNIYTFYVARHNGEVLGYSLIDTHIIRTKTETILITINPNGAVKRIDVLAFYEPKDYYPSKKWMGLFPNHKLDKNLRIGRDIPNMSGASLTSNALVAAVRKALALFELTCKDGVCKGV